MNDLLVPHPYPGLTISMGEREANVHFIDGDMVYYGMYADYANDAPCNCTALKRAGK